VGSEDAVLPTEDSLVAMALGTENKAWPGGMRMVTVTMKITDTNKHGKNSQNKTN
jgi:hypothetical protein